MKPAILQRAALLGLVLFVAATAELSAEGDAAASVEEKPPASVEDEVWAADRAFSAAGVARDKERFSAMILPEGIYLGQEIERGRDEFIGNWAPLFDPEMGVVGFEWEPLVVEASSSGDVAYSIGRVKISFRRRGSEEIVESPGHYLSVWRPDQEGAWKVWASGTLVVHPEHGLAHETRYGLSRAWDWPLLNAPDADVDIEWKPETSITAESGDFAVSFGKYYIEAHRGEEEKKGGGGYLTVRKKDEKGRWMLVAEGYTPPI